MGAAKQAMLEAMDEPDEDVQKRGREIMQSIEDLLADASFGGADEFARTVEWLQREIDATLAEHRGMVEDMEADEEIERLMAKDD